MKPETMGSTRPIHVFERPPVVETVLGVQFDKLPDFRNAHLGAFWKHLGSNWAKPSDAPLLDESFERFGEEQDWQRLQPHLRISQVPASRLQIRNAKENRMVQIQNGRLHYNWLGQGGEEYPHYSGVRPEFDGILAEFQDFVRSEDLGELVPNQWEVTYVNLILKDTVWNEPQDWAQVFVSLPGIGVPPRSVRLESCSGAWHFIIPPQRGRLHAQLAHGREGKEGGAELLRLTLTARGPVTQTNQEGMSLGEGLDLGRKTIVETFADITSESAHKYWGLIS